jgi:nucleoside-diphosphate-sugar epimerase
MVKKEDVILITGGSGFIGTNLIELFETKNYGRIVNFDKAKPLNDKQIGYWFEGNIMNENDLSSAFEKFKPNYIIHLAARTDTLSDVLEDYVENYEGTENVINEIKKHTNITHVIITSTQYVYKSKRFPFPSKEDDYLPHTVYGISKKMDEETTRSSNLQCQWTIVRPCNVWGPWHMRYPNELWKLIDRGFYVHPGKKEVIRTYAYVKNVVHQINEILNSPSEKTNRKTFYLGDLPIDSYDWLNCLSLKFREKPLKRVPIFIFAFPAIIGSALRKMGIPFPLYIERFKNMVEDYYAPTNITIREFGLYNSSLENNVTETIDWLKSSSESFNYWKNKYSNETK